MSLFAVISAVATDAPEPDDLDYDPEPDHEGADEIELTLAPPPLLAGGGSGLTGAALLTRREEKQILRDANASVARELVRRTGLPHGRVNAELNRLSGVRRVSEATVAELERRLAAGDRWLAKT
jgi:hypothetical protein